MSRAFIGISIGSGLEGIDAALVRTGGVGLGLVPRPERTIRIPLSQAILAAFRSPSGTAPDLLRSIAESAVQAARSVAVQAGLSARDVFAAGFLDPAHHPEGIAISWCEVAGRIAESTGLTTVHGFRDRDRAAGGAGRPITAVPDFLLYQNEREDRLLIHLGAMSSVLFIPALAKISAIHGFEVGPGSHWLDAIQFHGSRGKEQSDFSGKTAVQGRCLEPLLMRWLEHPYFSREAPKAVPRETFGRAFLHASFEYARTLGAGLPDMLCTANHLIARSI
ncbi:MAG TPA: anhydro-N-acetylmuramic acid kinase, partial [Urbifossiella sp.]